MKDVFHYMNKVEQRDYSGQGGYQQEPIAANGPKYICWTVPFTAHAFRNKDTVVHFENWSILR